MQERFHSLDIFRGWAILLMMIFHLAYNLNYFGYLHISFHRETFWIFFRFLIVSMFLFSVGISLRLSHPKHIHWNKVKKRFFILLITALLISIITYIQFPKTWVYFGIIHFIAISSLFALAFLAYSRFLLLLSLAILLASSLGYLQFHSLFSYLQPLLHLPKDTQDFLPIFPWFAVILLGIAFVNFGLVKKIRLTLDNPLHKILSFLGRHALIVYLIHSPILFLSIQVIRG